MFQNKIRILVFIRLVCHILAHVNIQHRSYSLYNNITGKGSITLRQYLELENSPHFILNHTNALIYTPNEIELNQCVGIITVGVLANSDCRLPSHCGQIIVKKIDSGWFTNSYLCMGIGSGIYTTTSVQTTRTIIEYEYDQSWRNLIVVTSDSLTATIMILHHPKVGYAVAPFDLLDHNVAYYPKEKEHYVPPLTMTVDSRYCLPFYTRNSIAKLRRYYDDVQDLLKFEDIPLYYNGKPSSFIVKTNYTLDYLYYLYQDNHSEIQVGSDFKSDLLSCKPYRVTNIYSPISLQGMYNNISYVFLTLVSGIYQLLIEFLQYLLQLISYYNQNHILTFSLLVFIYLIIKSYTMVPAIILTLLSAHIFHIILSDE